MEPPSLPKELSTSFIPQGDREGGCQEGGNFLYFLLESKHVLLKKTSWCGPHVTGLTLSFNNQTKRKKKNTLRLSQPHRGFSRGDQHHLRLGAPAVCFLSDVAGRCWALLSALCTI